MANEAAHVRRENDWYPTPAWCVDRLVEHPHISGALGKFRRIYDPCAGDGAILNALAPHLPHAELVGSDIDPRRLGIEREDYLASDPDALDMTAIVTNPPYSLAREFVERAMMDSPYVTMLLRLGFAASQARRDWLAGLMPSVYILPNRPSFTGDGKTDSYDYAWFVFGGNLRGRIEWLRSTTAIERRKR